MATIKQYSKKDGTKRWMFKTYLGINSVTGKQDTAMRRNFATRREAKAAMERVKVQYQNGELACQQQSNGDLFQEVFDLWKENYEYTVKESTFVKTVEQFKVHVLPEFGHKSMSSITVADVQKFINRKAKTYVKFRDLKIDIARIFEYAITLGIVDSNPAEKISIPRKVEKIDKVERKNYYSRDELKEFLKLCYEQQPFHIFMFFQLLSASGCRRGEILALEWCNVDFENQCIHIKQNLARGKDRRLYLDYPKTRHSKRTISLDLETMKYLDQWRSLQRQEMLKLGFNTLSNKNQLVFANQNNSFIQLSKPRTWMLQNIKKNNLREITVHGFRHTHATLLLEAGVAPKVISERLGHASIQITLDLYSHVTEKMETEVPNVFAKVMRD